MKILFTLLLLLLSDHINAQQWLDKKYSYDSILDVNYGSSDNFLGDTESHAMDIYLPICNDSLGLSRRPLIIFIHGGAFLAGSKDEANIQSLSKQFAERGYVTAAINYRLGFISDDAAWSCNYPNYNCVFAADSAEWIRSYYRAVQDGKGALRYLINRNANFRIDTNNVFIAGESAGAFVSLGVSLLDTISEKLPQTFAINSVPAPNSNSLNCVYNIGKTFPSIINRPDLGSIDGDIEPSSAQYTIKGIGNIFGGMMSNLLASTPVGKPKPAIYSFHQPCDMVVPIDSAKIYSGLSWCMTNGYNCFAIANTPKVYGSRGFSTLNTTNNHGYTIENHFTSTNFPYNFWFGAGSCADQVNNPCHAYDNFTLRTDQLAAFFAPLVSTSPICDTAFLSVTALPIDIEKDISIFPNPTKEVITIRQLAFQQAYYSIIDQQGRIIQRGTLNLGDNMVTFPKSMETGLYFVQVGSDKLQVKRLISVIN